MLRVLLPALLVVAVAAADAVAAPRVATTSEGVRMTLDGRHLSFRVPTTLRRGSDLMAGCGADPGFASVRWAVRPGRRLSVRLRGPLTGAPDWCGFTSTGPDGLPGPTGGAAFRPRVVPERVGPGPGVRSGASADDDRLGHGSLAGDAGDAAFHLRDRTLTVRLRRPLVRSQIVRAGCLPDGDDPDRRLRASASVAVAAGTRVVTVALRGGDLATVDVCLLEERMGSGSDIVAARLPR